MTTPDTKVIKAQMEALSGFARGPWKVILTDDTTVITHGRKMVAEIDGDYNDPDQWPIMGANARLIASAPDMHETILALCDALDELRAESERPGVADPLTAAALTLRDAIEGDDRADIHRLLLAACFGAERFDKMTASPITHDGAPMAMLRDLLTAIIDPNDMSLDDLRMINLAETGAAP